MSKLKMDSKPGMYSPSKPLLDKDKSMIKRVLKGVQLKRPNPVQSAMIRRHFLELTQTFMIPLERYLASLMPLAKNISPYKAAPQAGFPVSFFPKSQLWPPKSPLLAPH